MVTDGQRAIGKPVFAWVIRILPWRLRFKAVFQRLFSQASVTPFGGLWGGDGFEAVVERAFEGTYVRVVWAWLQAWERANFLGRDVDGD